MPEARLLVNNRMYSGWKSVRITRSIESLAGSFELEANDRWAGQDVPWAIAEEDACRVAIGDHVLIDGFVDRRGIQLSGQQRTLSYAGRDRAAVLVDSSAILERWTFRDLTPRAFVAKICEPFGITVSQQDGLKLERIRKLVINPGDSAFQVMQRVAASSGVLLVSSSDGRVVLTRAGTDRAEALVEGENILAGSVDYDGSQRFRRYVVVTSVSGDDDASGDFTRVRAEAVDLGVRREDRVLMIQPDESLSTARARVRGDWEARLRAARAETVVVTVQGWTQRDGMPWPVNALCPMHAPALGVDGTMLISEVEYNLDGGGQVTELRLVRPDAFEPEPRAVVRDPSKKRAPSDGLQTLAGIGRVLALPWKLTGAGGDE